jgi:hypothetical protein
MSRTHGIVGIVLGVVFLAAGFPLLVGSDRPIETAAPAAGTELTLPSGGSEELVCAADTAPSTLELEAAACSKCPPGQPKCIRDRDCDAVCGGRVEGSCVQINSCIRCCLCAT